MGDTLLSLQAVLPPEDQHKEADVEERDADENPGGMSGDQSLDLTAARSAVLTGRI